MSARGSAFLRPDARKALLGLVCVLVCIGAFALGWRSAGHEMVTPLDAANPATSTRAATRAEAATAAAKAASAADIGVPWPLWEFQLAQPIPESDPPRTPLPWRMIGASRAGGQWKLIVLRQGKPEPEYFGIGDKLPGGYRIEAISDEDVTLRQGRKQLILAYIGTQ